MKQGYSLRSTQDILAEKGSKHRMNRGAENRKRCEENRKKGEENRKRGAEKRKTGCGEEKKVYFGATVKRMFFL